MFQGNLVLTKLVSHADIGSGTYTAEITQQMEKLTLLHKDRGAHTSPAVVWRGRVSSELKALRQIITLARKLHVELPVNTTPLRWLFHTRLSVRSRSSAPSTCVTSPVCEP